MEPENGGHTQSDYCNPRAHAHRALETAMYGIDLCKHPLKSTEVKLCNASCNAHSSGLVYYAPTTSGLIRDRLVELVGNE